MDAQAFRRWRVSMNWSQEETARALDVSRRTVQGWETGVSPVPRMAAIAARALLDREELAHPHVPTMPAPPARGSFTIDLNGREAVHVPTGTRISFLHYRDPAEAPQPHMMSKYPLEMDRETRLAILNDAADAYISTWRTVREKERLNTPPRPAAP